jgi:hypothetical protein
MTAATYNPRLYIDGYSAPPTPGLYHVNVQGAYTASSLEDIGNAINTTGKTTGKKVWDSTNRRVMVAEGPAAGDDWTAANGSGSITPIIPTDDIRITEASDTRITEAGDTRILEG